MKSTRIPQFLSSEASNSTESHLRGFLSDQKTKIEGESRVEDISKKISECCAEDEGVALRLKDEFSKALILNVIRECRGMISENSMTNENWAEIGNFLNDELWKFSRLKEELVLAERKCGMVKQKASDISAAAQSGEGDEMRTRLMACAMLLAETEMRRDHLEERVLMIVGEFVTRILSDLKGSPAYTSLELRLRGVFGSL